MNELSLTALFGILGVLILCSAFFSGSETGMMAINRYRLRHRARRGDRAAKRTSELLERPDRLIGVILLGNNFVNILASSIATVIALRLLGEGGIAIAALLLTLVILIFAEVAPKTLAALHPETVAFPASLVLKFLLKVFYPLVWLVNWAANGLLGLLGVTPKVGSGDALSPEELRIAVHEAGALLPGHDREMLLGILDLSTVTVGDIMVPRGEVVGIDLEDDWDDVLRQLRETEYTRLPVFEGDLDRIHVVLHMSKLMRYAMGREPDREELLQAIDKPYFIPDSTSLKTQLVNFQHHRRRVALVVDEYGDVRGLLKLEDLLEEIVGEFTTDAGDDAVPDVQPEPDGSFLVDGTANLREINREMGWELPISRARTINGMILEHMQSIPHVGTCFLIAGYPFEVLQTRGHAVRSVRVSPRLRHIGGKSK